MKKAIITGATGFIGTHLVNELVSHDIEVTVICRKDSPNLGRLPADARIIRGFEEAAKADVFYHLAWEGASGAHRSDAVLQSQNAGFVLHALQEAARIGCGKFIAMGTIYENLATQVKSSGKFGGSDFYILSKDYAHSMSDQLAHKLDIGFTWVTVCHPIGKFIKSDQLMAYTVSNLLNGHVPSFGSAETSFDIVAVEDVAQGLYLLGDMNVKKREYYIGSGKPKRLREYLEKVRCILGVDTPLMIGHRTDDGLQFDESWFEITSLSNETGYEPKIEFSAAINNVANWVKRG